MVNRDRNNPVCVIAPGCYVDSGVLMMLALLLAPIPIRTVWRALRDIFGVAPSNLDLHVRAVMAEVSAD